MKNPNTLNTSQTQAYPFISQNNDSESRTFTGKNKVRVRRANLNIKVNQQHNDDDDSQISDEWGEVQKYQKELFDLEQMKKQREQIEKKLQIKKTLDD